MSARPPSRATSPRPTRLSAGPKPLSRSTPRSSPMPARRPARSATPPARTASKIVAEAKDTATAEAARLTAAAHAQIEAERQAALVSLRSEVGTLAIDLAGGVIGESLVRRQEGAGRRRPLPRRARGVRDRRGRDRGRNGQCDHSGARGDHGGARRRVGRRPRRSRASCSPRRAPWATRRSSAARSPTRQRLPRAARKVVADVFGKALAPTTVGAADDGRRAAVVVCGRPRRRRSKSSRCAPRRARPRSADVEGELFRFSRTIAANPELELALGSRLGDDCGQGARSSRRCLRAVRARRRSLIVSSLVQQPRERRIRQLLARAMDLVADQRGRKVATVVSAVPLSAAQTERLAAALSQALRRRGDAQRRRRPHGRRRRARADRRRRHRRERLIPPRRPPPAARRLITISRPHGRRLRGPSGRPPNEGRQWQNSLSAPTSSVTR